ncbi:MAG: isoprenoid biosynthesis glyoxalase ElbB [Nitrospinota bacterium]
MTGKVKKIGVILSGCGFKDGAEIQESVLTLLAIQKNNAEYLCFSPDIPQHHVTNHLTGESSDESRNVLVESARIARGKISPLSDFKPSDVDALILPGGLGAATNLSTFAFEGGDCTVNEEVASAIRGMVEAKKPIGALCIAPAIMAKLLDGVELTIGSDKGTAEALEGMGAKHKNAGFSDIVIDEKYRLVTTPCYMLDSKVTYIAEGAENLVKAVLAMT